MSEFGASFTVLNDDGVDLKEREVNSEGRTFIDLSSTKLIVLPRFEMKNLKVKCIHTRVGKCHCYNKCLDRCTLLLFCLSPTMLAGWVG